MRQAAWVLAIGLAMAGGCGDKNGGGAGAPPKAQQGAAESTPEAPGGEAPEKPAEPKGPELAASPVIDLVANRYRWHLYRPGLLVAMASEGMRKYSNDYSRPWGPVVEVDGKRGRVLEKRATVLRVPWETGGEATLVVRMHGVSRGQRLTVRVNGKHAGNLAPGASWEVLTETVTLQEGENEIEIQVRRRGRAGGKRTYGLFHSIELTSAEAPAQDWPALSPVAGEGGAALSGFGRMALWLEVPPKAHLVMGTRGEGRFRVKARTFDGDPVELLDETQGAGDEVERRVSLADFAHRLVRLELVSDEGGAWVKPRIALEKAGVRERPDKTWDNAILFVVDALRSDRLSMYGDTRVKTPRITGAFDSGGAAFLHNQAGSPSSPPSHATIQTGMMTHTHGVLADKDGIRKGTPMISTILGEAGVATAYYGNNPFGMARLEKAGKWTAFHQPPREGKGIDCTALIEEMLGFAKKQVEADKRFFISSLPYEPHTPYRYHDGITDQYYDGPWPPPVGKKVDGGLLEDLSGDRVKLSEKQWEQLKALYDGEVTHVDGCFGTLLDGLAEMGAGDSTLVVVTSDHGEGMYERGRMGHAYGHYRELGDVPFVLLAPGLLDEGVKVDVVTNHIDIVPTILDLMGVEAHPQIQGRSVVPLALREGPWTPRVVALEYGRSYALRTRRWKYIVGYFGKEELYDLETDPWEQKDLIGERPFVLRYLRGVAGFYLPHREDWGPEWGEFNDHSPGYVKATAGAAE